LISTYPAALRSTCDECLSVEVWHGALFTRNPKMKSLQEFLVSTKLLQLAHLERGNFDTLLDTLKSIVADSSVDWDRLGGEKWARIIVDGEVVSYIHSELNLAFALGQFQTQFKQTFEECRLNIFFVDSFDRKFSVEKHQLEQMFQIPLTLSLNYGALSINDLWWATVS